MFIDLDTTTTNGHPRALPVREKIDKILNSFNTKRNRLLNLKANELASGLLGKAQKEIFGKIEVNVIAMTLLTELEEIINLPKNI